MKIHIVDAFTKTPFAGNPAGVVLLDAFPKDNNWLQNVALEVNHPETAFAHPLPSGQNADWALRWFTPATEVALCGHATLATARVLKKEGLIDHTVRFSTLSGILTARVNPDDTIVLDFPSAKVENIQIPQGLEVALGGITPVSVSDTTVGDLLVELAREEDVLSLTPDLKAIIPYADRGVIVTSRTTHNGTTSKEYDFVSRAFYPKMGIDEDHVTGSAHTALAPFWSTKLGSSTLTGLQASPRRGLVKTTLQEDRTFLCGHAVIVIEGELLSSPNV